eukprot:355789-Rhodomonas_salina.1
MELRSSRRCYFRHMLLSYTAIMLLLGAVIYSVLLPYAAIRAGLAHHTAADLACNAAIVPCCGYRADMTCVENELSKAAKKTDVESAGEDADGREGGC